MGSRTETRSAAIERLEEERRINPGKAPKAPRSLPLREIGVEPAVFQVRAGGLDDERVEEISRDLEGTRLEDRVHVWWGGGRWIAIDGHHRLAAYQLAQERSGKTLKVPVEAHPDMSLGKALGAAVALNSREKVAITREEKGDAAWRLVCHGQGSIAEQSHWSGASKAQISNMRATLKRLVERGLATSTMVDQGWDWSRCLDRGKAHGDFTPDMQEAMAQDWAKRIGKALGGKATENPGVLARAIEIISPELPAGLIESVPFWDALNTTGRAMLEEFDQEQEGEDPTDF